MSQRVAIPCLAALALCLPAMTLTAPAMAASKPPACARARSRRASGCVPGGRTRGARQPFGVLDGEEYEFEQVQLTGTMTAKAVPGHSFDFEAASTTRITNRTRVDGDILRNERSDIGGRFMLRDRVVVAVARPVDYAIRSSARFADSNGTRDCTWNRPTQTDGFGMAIYPQRDRIAIRYTLVSGGWACRDAPEHPSCDGAATYDADVMFYKEIEFTRRWIKLPVDLQWRSRGNVACEFRWNGFVRLKKLRDGR